MNSIFNLVNQEETSATYNWLKKINKETLRNLDKTIEHTEDNLVSFLVGENVQIAETEKLANLLIAIWVRGVQALDMLKSINYEEERDRLCDGIRNAKAWIGTLERQKSSSYGGMKSIFNIDLQIEINVDEDIRLTQQKIEYFESILQQSYERGNLLNYDKVKKLIIFTMFYIGEELLNLDKSIKPKPVYTLVKMLTDINTGTPFDVHQLYSEYDEYSKLKINSKNAPIKGERLGVHYSFTPHENGWQCIMRTSSKQNERFIHIEMFPKEIDLVKFIYAMKIPDHILTMFIFDYEMMKEIITLLENK